MCPTTQHERTLLVLLACGMLMACSDPEPNPMTFPAAAKYPDGVSSPDVIYRMEDVSADFPAGTNALDTDSSAGNRPTPSIASDVIPGSEDFCRDAFKPVYLHWNGPNGVVSFPLAPPQLFVRYRPGTYKNPRGLVFFRAIYETIAPSQATDAAGDVWSFVGQFNALCRGGQYEVGPLVFRGQLIVTQDPITPPVLVQSGGGGGGGSCELDPYAYETYDPYSYTETDNTGCGTGDTNGDGSGSGGGGTACQVEFVYLEVSSDGGLTWTTIWQGDALVCE